MKSNKVKVNIKASNLYSMKEALVEVEEIKRDHPDCEWTIEVDVKDVCYS